MMDGPEQEGHYVITLLRREKDETSIKDHNIKLTLFDIVSGSQETFIFMEKEVLSEE